MRMIALTLLVLSTAAAQAADVATFRRSPDYSTPSEARVAPFPRSERAAAVWDSGTCWSLCGSRTAWGLPDCVRTNPQGECLAWANRADRFCQSQCRTAGGPLFGPLLPLVDW